MYKFKATSSLFFIALAYSSAYSNSVCEQENINNLNSYIASNCSDFTKTCIIDAPVAIYSDAADQLPNPLPPIQINKDGALCASNSTIKAPVELSAQSFFINDGLMQFGSKDSPLKNKITIKMVGKNSAAPAPKPLCKDPNSPIETCSTIAQNSFDTPNARDITVMGSGKLKLYGAKGLTRNKDTDSVYVDHKPSEKQTDKGDDTYIELSRDEYFNNIYGNQSWTYLSQPAGPSYYDSENAWVSAPVNYSNITEYKDGESKPFNIDPANYANYLLLSNNVDDDPVTTWQPGDWISVSTTSFSSHQTEIVQICKIHRVDNPERFSAKPPPIKLNYTLPETVSLIQLADGETTCDNGKKLEATPLKHYHFGSLAPTPGVFDATDDGKDFTNSDNQTFQPKLGQSYRMYDGSERNYGIDERAEVALLSKNIKFTSVAQPGGEGFEHLQPQFFGGHIAVMNHDGMNHPEVEIELVGVELEKFGQAMVGRYPVHLHRLNKDKSSASDPNQLLIQDVSVHHSFNKCFVVHETKSAKLYNNVCVRTIGQGMYLEDGFNVSKNTFIRNLIAGTMSAAIPYINFKPNKNPEDNYIESPQAKVKTGYNQFWDGDYLVMNDVIQYDANNVPDTSNSGANTGHPLDQLEPNGFWITNLNNVFVNNSVAGCQFQGRGYWIVNQTVEANNFQPQNAYPIFTGNRAHSCYGGLDTDSRMTAGINGKFTNNPKPMAPQEFDKGDGSINQPPVAIFNGLDITRIRYKGLWTRTLFSNITDSYFAAMKQGVTVLGGGGPESNLFGFWSMVQDSVFAGITRNNVDRYIDCENYAQDIAKVSDENVKEHAYEVYSYNEASECTSLPEMIDVVQNNKTNTFQSIVLAGDQTATNFNLQGYTYYDGPARLEHNRFINFRADATDRMPLETNGDKSLRLGASKVDVLKMQDYNRTSQISNKDYGGGKHYYGYDGDAAMSWLKANAQAVPPSQYSLGNIWQNTDFKHQVFTTLSNLSTKLNDGDKSTIIIDKDGTLSDLRSCDSAGNCNVGTPEKAHHFPISLNNLEIYATPYTVDEPDSSGRNNVHPSSLMSPHQYVAINIEGVGFKPGEGNHPKVNIIRDMPAYGLDTLPVETLDGRGGQGIYEFFFMNHMGYTIENVNENRFSNNLLFSYSDAPIEHQFANRIGICVGKGLDADKIKISKVLRQWGTQQNYSSQRSSYLTGDSQIKNQDTCHEIFQKNDAEQVSGWQTCFTNGTPLSKTDNLSNINKELVSVISDPSSSNKQQSYYYDNSSGILYFNMVQAGNPKPNTITTPYMTCDISLYQTALESIKQTKDYTDPETVKRALDIACLVEHNNPQPTELLACPDEGCATYAIELENAGTPQASNCENLAVNSASIIPPKKEDGKLPLGLPSINYETGQINYQSEFYLASLESLEQVKIEPASVLVGASPSYYHCSENVSYPQTGSLPITEIMCSLGNQTDFTENPGFSATRFGSNEPDPGPGPGPAPVDGVKWMIAMGPNVGAMLTTDSKQTDIKYNGDDVASISVKSGSDAGKNEFFHITENTANTGLPVTLQYGSPDNTEIYSCKLTLGKNGASDSSGDCNKCGLSLNESKTEIIMGANCE